MTTTRMEATTVAVKAGTRISAKRMFMLPSALLPSRLVWVVGPRTVRSKKCEYFFSGTRKTKRSGNKNEKENIPGS